MSRTIGIFTESSLRNSEIDLCRLCMKDHDNYYNIFSSSVACKITVKDALYDVVGLHIAVGDGLPTTMCPLCLKKLTEFCIFKKTCLESNAVLRKSLARKHCRSFEEGGAVDDNLGPSVETKDCIQDAIENNSQPTCSAQTTEIYIPVPDCLLPRDDKLIHVKDENEGQLNENYSMLYTSDPAEISSDAVDPLATDDLCHVKEENQDHLSEENYPMLYASNPAGISNDLSDPLVTDELSDPVMYKCSSVKEDQISDDEEGHVLNDCSDGVSNKLMHQDSSDQSDPVTYECSSVKEDKISNDEEGHVLRDCSDGVSRKLMHQDSFDQPNTFTASQGEKLEAQSRGDIVGDLDVTLIGAKKELSPEVVQPTLGEDGDPIETLTIAHEPTTEAFATAEEEFMTSSVPKAVPAGLQSTNIGDSSVRARPKKSAIRDVSLTTLLSSESGSSCEPTTSKTSYGLEEEKEGPKKKERGRLKETGGGKGVKKATIQGARSLDVEESKSSHIRKRRNRMVAKKKEKPCSCNECGKCFSNKSHLVTHLRLHRGEKPFSCRICEKSFTQQSTLKRHIRTHTGEKPFTCNVCEKSFSQKVHLASHMRCHTGERPYSCGICCKSFAASFSLSSHMRTHTREKPYSCSECEKSFGSRYVLVCHIRTHTREKPYSCHECEKSFGDKSNLVAHVRKHSGEKPYVCKVCGKSFSQSNHLVTHNHTHTGKKPFPCRICKTSFAQQSTFKRHLRTHT